MIDVQGAPSHYMMQAFSEDSILVATVTDNSIVLTTWSQDEVSTALIENPVPDNGPRAEVWLGRTDIWVISRSEGRIYRIDLATREAKPLLLDPEVVARLQGVRYGFQPYWVDGVPIIQIWYGDTFDLLALDEARGVFTRLEVMEGKIEDCSAFQDQQGNTLVYFRAADRSVRATVELKSGGRIDFSEVLTGYEDVRIESIVSEDFTKSLLVCHTRGLRSHLIADRKVIQKTLDGRQIRAMTELDEGRILVTTQNAHYYEVELSNWDHPTPLSWPCTFGRRKFVYLQDGATVVASNRGLLSLDLVTGQCQNLVSELGSVVLATSNGDAIGMISAEGIVYEYDVASKSVRLIGHAGGHIQIPPRLHDMTYSGGFLWIASSNGLWKIDPQSGEYSVVGKEYPFTDYHFLCIRADQAGRLWLGTTLGGVQIYDPESGSVEVLDSRNGLPNNTVVSIQEDHDGDLWVATYDGVALVNSDGKVLRVFDELDGLADNESNRYAGLVTSSGKVLIGSINGLSLIDPNEIKRRGAARQQPRIYLTDLEYKQNAQTDVHITDFAKLEGITEITLPAQFRSLRARFGLSDFVLAGQNTYEWKFSHQESWRTLGQSNSLELDDIRPGRHAIQIRGANREGIVTSNVIRLGLHVRSYFYQSWWFYVLCALLIIGLAMTWILRLRWAVARATDIIHTDKQIIEAQADRLRELDEAKSRYFTEISHELRTPLTIISGMSAQILEEPEKWAAKGATLIRNNSQRLLKLVNQILDLRQLESSEIQFRMVQGNIVAYLSYLADTFSDYAQTKDIDFSFIPFQDEIIMDYDPDRTADIVSNLVSNAIKFCEPGDQVRLEVEQATVDSKENCIIRVIDSGAGIAEDELPHIFDRFYRITSDRPDIEGSGVGLALVNELVRRLDGELDVKSKLNEGSTFIVTLPLVRESTIRHDVPDTSAWNNTVPDQTSTEAAEASISILVVEDHPDLITYMRTILEGKYAIHVAQNGRMGEDMAYELIPDLIISDIMMPGQSGLDLCSALKSDRRTDHIPIVLLTAKSGRETKLESLKRGADAFLTKPFYKEELLTIISNLLDQRRQLQQKYANGSGLAATGVQNPQVEDFVRNLNQAIDEHMEDDEFSVVHLCRALSMSRTNLHNKIKAVTGRSTTGYIRLRRLLKAKELLQQGNLNVSEVAYAVGFKSQSYFSTSFAREFGAPPSASA
ncbi:MAG: ATP-binding protein [Saprospiraceae bacterium]|nr:ATP-binding protein [Saprospiraceae bacterium]